MKKVITAGEKQIHLQTDGFIPLLYKKEFKRDFFADIKALIGSNYDIEILYNMIWVFAKTADDSIEDLNTWLKSFEAFPVKTFFNDIMDLIIFCVGVKDKKEKKKKATEKN